MEGRKLKLEVFARRQANEVTLHKETIEFEQFDPTMEEVENKVAEIKNKVAKLQNLDPSEIEMECRVLL